MGLQISNDKINDDALLILKYKYGDDPEKQKQLKRDERINIKKNTIFCVIN